MNDFAMWEAEASVIGGLMIDFHRCKQSLLELVPGEFQHDDLRRAFEAIRAIDERRGRVDYVTVLAEVGDSPEIKVSLASAVEIVPSLGNYESYVDIVKSEAQRRRVMTELTEIMYGSFAAPEMLGKLQRLVDAEQAQDSAYRDDMMLYKLAEYMAYRADIGEQVRTVTGYSDLDALLGGMAPGDFTVLGARPAMGKTAFAGCLTTNLVEKGKKVDFFSIEMSTNQLFDRLGANAQTIDHDRMRKGRTSKAEDQLVFQSLQKLTDTKRFYLFDTVMNIERIESIVAKSRPDVVIIDYLQLARSTQKFRDAYELVSHVSQSCKIIAKKYQCHVIALAQLSRDVERRKVKIPMLSDLRESGSIEQDADAVIFLYREHVYNKYAAPEKASAIVAKNRHGNTGIVDLRFLGQYQRFVSVDHDHEDPKAKFTEVGKGTWPPEPEQTTLS